MVTVVCCAAACGDAKMSLMEAGVAVNVAGAVNVTGTETELLP
jgi:hypothetical protein